MYIQNVKKKKRRICICYVYIYLVCSEHEMKKKIIKTDKTAVYTLCTKWASSSLLMYEPDDGERKRQLSHRMKRAIFIYVQKKKNIKRKNEKKEYFAISGWLRLMLVVLFYVPCSRFVSMFLVMHSDERKRLNSFLFILFSDGAFFFISF